MKVFALVLVALATSASLFAAVPVPEIDPASGASAFALLTAAALMIRGRRKK
jgi:hypothetical protein